MAFLFLIMFCVTVCGTVSAGGAGGEVLFGTAQIFDQWNPIDDHTYERSIKNSDNAVTAICMWYNQSPTDLLPVRSVVMKRSLKLKGGIELVIEYDKGRNLKDVYPAGSDRTTSELNAGSFMPVEFSPGTFMPGCRIAF